ncbi:hypothetical protein [Xanthobacter sediminis]
MLLNYIIALGIAGLAILLGIILGDYGPWYLSWFLGTGFMVLVAVSAGVLFEAQDDSVKAAAAEADEDAGDVVRVIGGSGHRRPTGGTQA